MLIGSSTSRRSSVSSTLSSARAIADSANVVKHAADSGYV